MAKLCDKHTPALIFGTLLVMATLIQSSVMRSRQMRQSEGGERVPVSLDELSVVTFPDTGARKRDPILQPSLAKMAASNAEFTWDSYKALEIPPTENVFFSSYSIMNALGMLTLGSDGTTKTQLKNVLRVDPSLSGEVLHDGLRLENDKLQKDDAAVFAVANRFFVESSTTQNINPVYLTTLDKYYNATMEAVNFNSDPTGARNTVNDWVDRNTCGKIREFLPANLDQNTQLILANAIYFKGNWDQQFNPDRTFNSQFKTSSGQSVEVPFMHLNAQLYYAHDEFLGLQTVIIPYTNFKYAMHIILPDETQSLATLEDSLGHLHLDKIDRSTRLNKVLLKMPKFNMRQRISLQDMLFRMNATDVFNPLKNDFSGLFLNSRPGFFVDEVIHEAVVEVNEEGTEAAAATGIVATRVAQSEIKVMVLDRPFLFYISDESNGFILFWGRMENPTK